MVQYVEAITSSGIRSVYGSPVSVKSPEIVPYVLMVLNIVPTEQYLLFQ